MIRMNGGALWVVQLVVVLLVVIWSSTSIDSVNSAPLILSRKSFPPGFLFGTASASYQYEGAANEGGRGPSIWDFYTHKYPKRVADRSNGDVAVDFYHRYKEDVQIMKNMGLDAFRFSISWSRILPRGSLKGGINKEGIEYYNNLINELLSNGITPFVTIFHWDTPQILEDEYGGFLSSKIVDDFGDYAELCFKEFGDRVKHWITLNEPFAYAAGGYALGMFAPGRCSPAIGNCTKGNSGTEPYIVGHNLLLSHAKAVKLYRAHYQENQKGMIGVTFVSHWMVPYSHTKANRDAAGRALDFMFGWFMQPISKGEYPKTMKSLVKNRLPKFTEEQSKSLKGSFDFLGLNYYSARYASPLRLMKNAPPSYTTDFRANLTTEKDGVQIGPRAGSDWLYIYPKGIQDLLVYTKKKYGNPVIYITENGVSEVNNASWSLQQALNDTMRVNYYQQHLSYVSQAIKQGVNVKGYFAWSLLDNFEWNVGYTVRFGINYVDYKNGLKRYPKLSVSWFKKLLKRQTP